MQTVKQFLWVLVAFVLGSLVNMSMLKIGHHIFPLPPGTDTSSMEKLAEAMHLFQFKHFVFPFLAHALGTFSACILVLKFSTFKKQLSCYFVTCLFFIGGLTSAFLLPAPTWFIALDLLLAYWPMAWLAKKVPFIKSGQIDEEN